jgi:prepilin peptidase CpaA
LVEISVTKLLDADHLNMARYCAMLALVIASAYTDIAKGKIYNFLTFGGIILGFVISGIQQSPTRDALMASLLGGLVGGGPLLLMYFMRGMNAGDVKLMTAVGVLSASLPFTVKALFLAALVGFVIAVAILIWKQQLRAGLAESARLFLRFGRRKPAPANEAANPEAAKPLTMPYGVAIAIGTVWALVAAIWPL